MRGKLDLCSSAAWQRVSGGGAVAVADANKNRTKRRKKSKKKRGVQRKGSQMFFAPGAGLGRSSSMSKADVDGQVARELLQAADVQRERDIAHNMELDLAVRLKSLRKVYETSGERPKVAVRDLNLGIRKGEVFGLLGTNGAGKTTSLNILSGMFPPTSGHAYVAGLDVADNLERIYTMLGICPQFDVVFDDLTVFEHLLFYARLKGVSSEDERALCQTMAEIVSLDGDALGLAAKKLSGGMRRRLSIAISLISNPKVLLLDEPTTGLSPDARREVWKIIQSQMGKRTIIVTSHSMEEIDTLCERVAIMSKGELVCVGSKQELKERFGEGYHLLLSLEQEPTSREIKRLLAFVRKFGGVHTRLESVFGTQVVFMLPKANGVETVLEVFKVMERYKTDLKQRFGIEEWGLSQTSLEEVFVNVVRHEFEDGDDDSDDGSEDGSEEDHEAGFDQRQDKYDSAMHLPGVADNDEAKMREDV
eukprot:TRINITY_DN62215_c0_g1_i1.p1 TRINITY_DN62215_c0_g1~~TRINITY_DN62215_c0_g1_i1.p1  ORF type:complete len:550 (-),score=282.71 TRINITY_DN62215_c0_g1_i1:161-1591(-)